MQRTFKNLNFIKKRERRVSILSYESRFIERICLVNFPRLSSAPCSGLIWTVTQGRSLDGDKGGRGREWDCSDGSRERNLPCLLTPTLFFSLSLCSVCGISRCSSETRASREWRQPFLAVSLLWEDFLLSGSLHLWEDSRNTTSPSRPFSSLLPSVLALLTVEASWLKLLSTLKIPWCWSPLYFILCWISELLQMWLNWNSRLLSCGLEVPLWCFPLFFFSCGPESILFLFFSSHATMFARIFIPKKHRQRFDDVVSQNMINRLCRSKSISEPQGKIRRSRSEDHSDRNRSSKRASSVPRDGEQGGRSETDKGARKSVSGISVHPPIGPHQRLAHIWHYF